MTTVTTDLAEWLLEQVSADAATLTNEQVPNNVQVQVAPGVWALQNYGYMQSWRVSDARWKLTIDKPRLLAACEAKRQIIAMHSPSEAWTVQTMTGPTLRRACTTCGYYEDEPVIDWPCPTLRALALPYADRPGYREEWRPQT